MPIDEQVIKLALDLGASDEEAERLAKALDRINASGKAAAVQGLQAVEAEVYDLADTYELVESAQSQVITSTQSMTGVMVKQSDVLREIEATGTKVSTSLKAVDSAGKTTTASVSAMNQRAIAATYAIQDFASANGGLAQKIQAVSNNIPMIVGGLGVWGAAIGGVVAVGATLYQNWDSISRMLQSTSPIPPIVDNLDRWKEALDKTTKEIEHLREAQSLTSEEMKTYNRLLGEAADLESQIAEERERRNAMEALGKLVPDEQSKRAAGFKKAIGESGGVDAATDELFNALLNIAQQTGQKGVTRESAGRQAEDLMIGASRGDKDARDTIIRAIGYGQPEGNRKFGKAVVEHSPEVAEAKKADAAAAKEAERAAKEAERAAAEAEQVKERDRKLTEDLSEQGRENQRASDAAEERRAKDEADVAERATKKAEAERKRRTEQLQQRQEATAEEVSRQTGGQAWGQPFAAAMERSLELQAAGMQRTEATQFAIAEVSAVMAGMGQQLMQLRNNEAMILAKIAETQRALQQASIAPSALNSGNGR